MQIAGRRVHIAGSASADTAEPLIRYAHELVGSLFWELAKRGATFAVGVGKEPLARPDDPSSPSLVFDWTVIATASAYLVQGGPPATRQGRLIATMATVKTDGHVPDDRRAIWGAVNTAGAVSMTHTNSGWASGAYRRAELARQGDLLIVLGGGEGVEHLSQLYASVGKPVIALDLDLGSSSADGSGGAERLADRALTEPIRFVRLSDQSAAGSLLTDITTRSGERPIREVVSAVIRLIEALASPKAFYVRLLDPKATEYEHVERFFRNVVDPVIDDFGFEPTEMGRGANEYAWINQAIFDELHHSAVTVVDLTGLRPNCFMELGYALGHAQRVVMTAGDGTTLPFDAKMFEYHRWSSGPRNERRRKDFMEHWERNVSRPPLVRPRGIL